MTFPDMAGPHDLTPNSTFTVDSLRNHPESRSLGKVRTMRHNSAQESFTIGALMKQWKKGLADEVALRRLSASITSFSLGSMHYSEGDLNIALPLPGRESHTADLERFDYYLNQLRDVEREEKSVPFNPEFWDNMRTFLEFAEPVGYDELAEDEVKQMGPNDGDAFLQKMARTDLINPIHPNLIADSLLLPLQDVITELLYAVEVGMMTMSWGPSCSHCDSMVCGSSSTKSTSSSYCGHCRYKHTDDALSKIQVVFSFVHEVFFVLADNFISKSLILRPSTSILFQPVPATFTGSGFRYSVGCGGDRCIRPSLPAGTYWMHCPVAGTENYLCIERNAGVDDEPITLHLDVSDLKRGQGRTIKTVFAEHGKIHFDIFTNTQSFFFLWICEDKDEASMRYLPSEYRPAFTEAHEILRNPAFHELFGDTLETRLSAALRQMQLVEEEQVVEGALLFDRNSDTGRN